MVAGRGHPTRHTCAVPPELSSALHEKVPYPSMSKNLSPAAALAARRQALRLTMADVAMQAGVSRPTVAALESGRGQRASLDAVTRALGLRLVGADGLSAARDRRGWSVPVAAARARLSAPTVRLIEGGGGRVESLIALAATVGVNLRMVEGAAAFYDADGAGLTSARTGTGRDEWYTPINLLEAVQQVLGIEQWSMDPCSPGAGVSPVRAWRHVTAEEDSLSLPAWGGSGDTAYVNPPFSRLAPFAARCMAEAARGLRIVLLVPARPGTAWWRASVGGDGVADVVFLGRRLSFSGPDGPRGPAPFDVALVLRGWPAGAADQLAKVLPGAWSMPARRVALAA